MKTFSTLAKGILSFGILASTLFFISCGGDSPSPSASEVTTKQLTSTGWKISTVQVEGTDQTALFANMTLSFTPTNYATTKGGVVWPASGTWTFTDVTAKKIKRSDNLEVTITEISDTSLKLSLSWASGTFGPGRTISVAGSHVFSFIK